MTFIYILLAFIVIAILASGDSEGGGFNDYD
jgi:hypothetical protein